MNYNKDQDFGFTMDQLDALTDMLGGNTEPESQHVFGSALNPGSLHNGEKDKEIAQPGVKMNAVVNNRNPLGGGAILKENKLMKEETKYKANDIWTEEEINVQAEERPDDRPTPEYEILHK